jgi:hypothetical protein
MKLSVENVDKVFINEKSLFTITKWVKIAGFNKIVNLKPVKNIQTTINLRGPWAKLSQ